MRKLFFTLLLLNICRLNVSGQDYNSLIGKAEQKFREGHYRESAELYEKAFEIEEGSAYTYYRAAAGWALAGDQDMAFDNLNSSIGKGFKKIKVLEEDSAFSSLREESRWKVLLAKLQAQIEKYERHFNKALRSELIAMQEEEQASRKIWLEMEEKHGAGSGSADSMLILTKEIDKKNTARLKELIATYGFPKADSVGSEGVFAAFLIVQHSPDPEFQKECLPHLLEAAGKKEIKFSQVALLHDRILMKEGKKQLYGTQVVTNKKTGKKELYPIEDEANVNERREEAGLTPLENYLKKFGINYVPKE